MPWKLDENKKIIVDENGNPVWESETGEEKSVDYPGLLKRLSEVNGESNGRKQEIRALKEKLALFDGIDDLKAWKDDALAALEFRKNAPDKDKEIEAQIAARLESEAAKFQAQLSARDKSLSEKEKLISEQNAKIRDMSIGADVKNSKLLARLKPEMRVFMERELTRSGALDEEGLIYYRDSAGKPFYNSEGKYANREEAPLLLMKELGIDSSQVLMSSSNESGSGGLPNGGSGGKSGAPGGKKYTDMTQAEKIDWLKNSNNLKSHGV